MAAPAKVSLLRPPGKPGPGHLLPFTVAGWRTAPDCLRSFDFGLPNDAGRPLLEWTKRVWPPQAGTKTVSRRTSSGDIVKFAGPSRQGHLQLQRARSSQGSTRTNLPIEQTNMDLIVRLDWQFHRSMGRGYEARTVRGDGRGADVTFVYQEGYHAYA